jgi:segregation and condensation protein B
MQTLVERGLVEAVGRAEVAGRPITYGTTLAFLEYFGLRNLSELPAADELRRIPVKKADPMFAPAVEPQTQTTPLVAASPSTAPSEKAEPKTASAEPAASAEPVEPVDAQKTETTQAATPDQPPSA